MVKKDDRVIVEGNSIFECMGFHTVNGTVINISPSGKSFNFKCEQTRCIEVCDLDDGRIFISSNDGE